VRQSGDNGHFIDLIPVNTTKKLLNYQIQRIMEFTIDSFLPKQKLIIGSEGISL